MAGKRVSLASLAAGKVEAVPGASRPDLVHVHPDTVTPTPLNPRRAFDETELAELGEDMRNGQLQPCVAVSKAAYLKLYPEHEDQLPDTCRYVMAAGERRWRAARQVGLDSLDLMLRHDLTETRVRFLAAVLSENVQRANFNPIEEADGLRAMLELHDGNQAAAARAMGKSKAWFNQRIGLLRLSDEMVQLVLQGELTAFRDMRRFAALPPDEQYATWKREKEQPAPPQQAPAAPAATAPANAAAVGTEQPETYTAVYAPAGSPPAAPDGFTVVEPDGCTVVEPSAPPGPAATETPPTSATSPAPAPRAAEAIPDPRAGGATAKPPTEGPPRQLPYDDGVFIAHHLIRKMPADELEKCFLLLLKHREKQTAGTD
ncbi:ParB/RepB/Spo0J family partition protein [Streptomyces sp. AC627_RSS907]|uniref:ParB/RepB/Spo0J family partition protein n=1 Tax=Streptomyces sp. AC627_RSS907 TaxID=2823684 RepID=UPI001C237CB2|nr:ParB/RepB/Spo0J family partition protein [Streptomyces sp. AC627_RSS907]